MDQELKEYLDRIEARMTSMETHMTSMETRMVAHLNELKTYIDERYERLETTLLTEFHKWSSPVEMRIRSHSALLRALDVEVESLSDRLKKALHPESGAQQ